MQKKQKGSHSQLTGSRGAERAAKVLIRHSRGNPRGILRYEEDTDRLPSLGKTGREPLDPHGVNSSSPPPRPRIGLNWIGLAWVDSLALYRLYSVLRTPYILCTSSLRNVFRFPDLGNQVSKGIKCCLRLPPGPLSWFVWLDRSSSSSRASSAGQPDCDPCQAPPVTEVPRFP